MNQLEKIPELIKEYIRAKGSLYRVLKMDVYRDGGTGLIETTKQNFFIHKKDKTIHTGMPTPQNLLTDKPSLAYLQERLTKFLIYQQERLNRDKAAVAEIKWP